MTGQDKKQINAWVPTEMFDKVAAIAKADDRSISSWVRRLIERELKKNQGGVGD